jgi:hypothetical protein
MGYLIFTITYSDGRVIPFVFPFEGLPQITDGHFGTLIVPPNAYSDLGILFQEPYGPASQMGYTVDMSFWHWSQASCDDLITSDGSPRGVKEAVMIAFLKQEIRDYYAAWMAIMKEQGKSYVVYSDSALGNAIVALRIEDITTVKHPDHERRRYM